jgi:hypothetical protein
MTGTPKHKLTSNSGLPTTRVSGHSPSHRLDHAPQAITSSRTTAVLNSISGRKKDTRKAPVSRKIPLKVAHFAYGTNQNARIFFANRLSPAKGCPAYQNSTVLNLKFCCGSTPAYKNLIGLAKIGPAAFFVDNIFIFYIIRI